jgi:Na+/H+ antiporter NhaD/arsenite permease-like protein
VFHAKGAKNVLCAFGVYIDIVFIFIFYPMTILLVVVFMIGYVFITIEHSIGIDKSIPALMMGALCWAVLSASSHDGGHTLQESLQHHIADIAGIIVFLMGAMTIVELIDLHGGFTLVSNLIRTTHKLKLLWLICFTAFFLSAILDNLTSVIVMVSILKTLIKDKETRLWYVGMCVIAANAGGAWSPIGDVTTTMLWMNGKISTIHLIKTLFIPSLLCLTAPLIVLSFFKRFQGDLALDAREKLGNSQLRSSRMLLFTGLGALIFVPIFKTLTGLPPYIGMMLALGTVWLVSEFIHPDENFSEEKRELYTVKHALSRIDTAGILFFLGILMGVAALETGGILSHIAQSLDTFFPNKNIVALLLGGFSAVIDNVPLVAASMSMYQEPLDASLWHFLAYTCGTGGSMLIIGSAAGVAAMGLEDISFVWYLKKMTLLALLGYMAGAGWFLMMGN